MLAYGYEGSTEPRVLAMIKTRRDFVEANTLPSNMLGSFEQILRDAGAKFEVPHPARTAPEYIRVVLPGGWTRVGTKFPQFTSICDEQGRTRATVNHRGSSRDTVTAVCRFQIEVCSEPFSGRIHRFEVLDSGVSVFKSEMHAYTGFTDMHSAFTGARGECSSWLLNNSYPRPQRPDLYWD